MSSEGQRYNGHFQYFPHKQCKLHRMRLLFDEIRFIYCVSCSSRGRLRPLPPCHRTNKLIYSTTEATRSVTTSFQRARNIITGGDRGHPPWKLFLVISPFVLLTCYPFDSLLFSNTEILSVFLAACLVYLYFLSFYKMYIFVVW